ncbi:T9SS type A sorting domain-containing protein [Crocinitomix catalasitica]|nr:T9SS type A sorting domain-containing protein [Crocinitomix catalasitica]
MKQLYLFLFATFLFPLQSYTQSEFWGVTTKGGVDNFGTIYKMDFDGSNFMVMHEFDFLDGATPKGSIFEASNGNLYGTCLDGGALSSCIIWRYDLSTSTFANVWDFDVTKGDFPQSGMIEYGDDLYGVAWSGGFTNDGVIYAFNLTTNTYDTVYTFNNAMGANPIAEPLLVTDVLYGTTIGGGLYAKGVIWEYSIPTDSYDTLHNFQSTAGDTPESGVILGTDGNLYGMTSVGGTNNLGTIYRYNLALDDHEVLYEFDLAGGNKPRGALMQISGGLFYGMTQFGGATNKGTIFSFDPFSSTISWLHEFDGPNGAQPFGDLVNYGDFLFGTTNKGGVLDSGVTFQYKMASSTYSMTNEMSMANGGLPVYGGLILIGADPTVIEEQGFGHLSLYPNPSPGQLTIDSEHNGELTIINLLGEVVHYDKIEAPQIHFNLDLPRGNYIWEFKNDQMKKKGKLVIL